MVNLPTITIKKDIIRNLDKSTNLEWIITNGLGGYASSTILGMNTRKYHGLLIVSKKPPLNRKVVLSKLEEELEIDGNTFELSTNQYIDIIHPKGYEFLEKFELNPFPKFLFDVKGVKLKKEIFMFHHKNIVVIFYEIDSGKFKVKLRIKPLINYRPIFEVTKDFLKFNIENTKNSVRINFNHEEFLDVASSAGNFILNTLNEEQKWYKNFFYQIDAKREEECLDNSYNPGVFETECEGKKKFYIIAKFCDNNSYNVNKLVKEELKRKEKLLNNFFKKNKIKEEDWIKWLVLATDNHIIKRHDGKNSVIAGYHWFGEWGRDTFISLPGLCLATGRIKEAKSIIELFLSFLKNGLIPNYLPTKDDEIAYNSVDASLWFINAVYLYFKKTNDLDFIKNLWERLRSIIYHYVEGTEYGIKMDNDYLIQHSERLTWMDASWKDKIMTSRSGKAVEIQALWYNALKIMEFFSIKLNRNSRYYNDLAENVRVNFNKKFWNGSYLDDCLGDSSIRPNQIFAIALDFPVLDRDKWDKVVSIIEKDLLTETGLRTLSKNDSRYRSKFQGSREEMEYTYHNGAVWPWLLSFYVKAYLKVKRDKKIIQKLIKPYVEKDLNFFGLGTLTEVFDGDNSYNPKIMFGCVSQAWSIATILESIS